MAAAGVLDNCLALPLIPRADDQHVSARGHDLPCSPGAASDKLDSCPAGLEETAVTSLMAEASSFMAFTQPQIFLCGASPDAARWASPAMEGKLQVGSDKIRRHAAEVPIPPLAEAAGPPGTH
jgi:hypothetical protein